MTKTMSFISAMRRALGQIKKMSRNLREGAELNSNYCEEVDRILKRKDNKMEPKVRQLDIAAIRKRVLDEAVVAHDNSGITILIPLIGSYPTESREDIMESLLATHLSISDGMLWNPYGLGVDWTIRPGDRAEFSVDGRNWHEGVYGGINGSEMFCEDINMVYVFIDSAGNDIYRHIRPVPQSSPEKVEILRRADAIEKELAELKKQAEGMK